MTVLAATSRFTQNAILVSLDAGDANSEYGGPLLITNLETTVIVPSGIGAGTYLPFPEFDVKLPAFPWTGARDGRRIP